MSNVARRRSLGVALAAGLAAVPAFAASAHTDSFTLLYDFTNKADGGRPIGGVIADAAGALYGTTYNGGASNCAIKNGKGGCGTIYSFTPAGGLKTLFAFTGANGGFSENGLALVGSILYGSTDYGGASDDGVLFSIHTDGTGYTVLHQFSGADGKIPTGTLRVGPGGVLYGLTAAGGAYNDGVLFSLKPDGTYTVLHSFTGGADGNDPDALLFKSGVIVGSTFSGGTFSSTCTFGCGVVFTYTLANAKFAVQHSFTYLSGDGASPYVGSLGAGPIVYGNADNVFSIGPSNGFSVIAHFGQFDGGDARSGPALAPDGSLVGVNSQGPIVTNAYGTLYSVANGVVTDLWVFGSGPGGGEPLAQPIITPSGSIIGTSALYDVCNDCGAIWEYTP